jgi:hypothetical protein
VIACMFTAFATMVCTHMGLCKREPPRVLKGGCDRETASATASASLPGSHLQLLCAVERGFPDSCKRSGMREAGGHAQLQKLLNTLVVLCIRFCGRAWCWWWARVMHEFEFKPTSLGAGPSIMQIGPVRHHAESNLRGDNHSRWYTVFHTLSFLSPRLRLCLPAVRSLYTKLYISRRTPWHDFRSAVARGECSEP